jgi:hypothetical protein
MLFSPNPVFSYNRFFLTLYRDCFAPSYTIPGSATAGVVWYSRSIRADYYSVAILQSSPLQPGGPRPWKNVAVVIPLESAA